MTDGFRIDNNYGNIEPLFNKLLDSDVDCHLIKSKTGTYIRTRNEKNNYGASIIEEYQNCKSDNPRFELALIELDCNNFEVVQHEAITDDVLRFLTKSEVVNTISKINNL